MTSVWLVVIAVGAGMALLSALTLSRRGGKIRGDRQRTSVAPKAVTKPAPTEMPSPPPIVRRPTLPLAELLPVGGRVRIKMNSDELLVRKQQGSDWVTHAQLPWEQIVKAYLRSGTLDAPLALYATTKTDDGGTRKWHLVDSQQLNRRQWDQLASAVAGWTNGRLVIDLSPLDDPPSAPDM